MRRRMPVIAGVLFALLLLAGIGNLFRLRFRAGDLYPPYSTFRADPLGARAFHDSLAALPGYTVTRNLAPPSRLAGGTNTVLLFLGDTVSARPNADRLSEEGAGAMRRFMLAGGRLVVTLQPRERIATESDGAGTNDCCTLTNWLETAFAQLPPAVSATATATAAGVALGLPPFLECHTRLCFTNPAPAWRTLYACAGRPVVMERPFGRGSLALSALSYEVSNESLREARQTGFLLWLLGGRHQVIFDETHHGVQESPGVMSLVRRYGLTWALANLLLLAALFIWRNSGTLVPVDAAAEEPEMALAAGRDSAAGLANLLRRNLAPGGLMETCLAEWRRTAEAGAHLPAATVSRITALIEAERQRPERQRSPERLYNAICELTQPAGGGGPRGEKREAGKEQPWKARN